MTFLERYCRIQSFEQVLERASHRPSFLGLEMSNRRFRSAEESLFFWFEIFQARLTQVQFGENVFTRPADAVTTNWTWPGTITGVHNNQDLLWCVKIGVYMGFCIHRGF